MWQPNITTMAQRLIARRNAANGLWFYASLNWRRQLLFLAGYIAVPIGLWYLGWNIIAVAFVGFFVGTKIRDVRWWVAISKQWPLTAEFLDWQKIEAIAGESNTDA